MTEKFRPDNDRVTARLEEIYECGRKSDGTFTRIAFSPEDVKGRELFSSWALNLGMEKRMDKAGNIIFSLKGKKPELPVIAMGSHLDTVPDGGKFDGVAGCVGALEAVEILKENGISLLHTLEIIVFADEEGARFSKGLTGSSAMCGTDSGLKASDTDADGISAGDALERIGISIDSLSSAERNTDEITAFLELHIEQGSLLYKNNIPVGIVSSIAGVERLEAEIRGTANHSGSTMMDERKDALLAAAAIIAEIPHQVKKHGGPYSVATVGAISITPGSVNVIPGSCRFTLEIRDQSYEVMEKIKNGIKDFSDGYIEQKKMKISWEMKSEHKPVPMDGPLKEIIRKSCEDECIEYMTLPSGAFHDSLVMAEKFKTAMIFVPSEGGLSHSHLEYTHPDDLGNGIRVLINTLMQIDLHA